MKTQYISRLAALLIGSAVINSSVLAGPGQQTTPQPPKRHTGTTSVMVLCTKVIKPTTSTKKSVVTQPRPKLLTAGQGTVVVR